MSARDEIDGLRHEAEWLAKRNTLLVVEVERLRDELKVAQARAVELEKSFQSVLAELAAYEQAEGDR
jgi:regulator of replication initiation timing